MTIKYGSEQTEGASTSSTRPPEVSSHTFYLGRKVASITGMDKDHLLVSLFSQGLFIFHKETHRYQPLVIINDSINDILCHRGKTVNVYQKYYNRVSLNLGRTSQADKPTDVRVKEFATSNDPHLVALYFQFGRYLLISSSQPGGQPANLQGIWNQKLNPAWKCRYTTNINAEMNYWPAEVTNLREMHEPFLQMVKELYENGQEAAREMYGCRGWVLHHNTDLWRMNGAVDRAYCGPWPTCNAWLCQHLWDRYLYSGDKEYLGFCVSYSESASEFFVDF